MFCEVCNLQNFAKFTFLLELREIFKNTFFEEHLGAAASKTSSGRI